jgi:UDP-sulfoquinovose synthase
MGLKPTTLSQSLMGEIAEIAEKYIHRCDVSRIMCTSYWTEQNKP